MTRIYQKWQDITNFSKISPKNARRCPAGF